MQQICEPKMCEAMPADVRSIWPMPNSDDEVFRSLLSVHTGKPVAIEVVGQ
jgi:hypothetical protein